ncbi:MAG TPA: TetR/AcrR family transcriptional regulator [Methylomirabilota bacterium]|nr:TetR/AcrR family transcriptional regulator [Methylomirabilota bacterium]
MARTAIPTKSSGRPRSEASRTRILKAAAALLATEGPRRITIEGVADKAGVSKATIYRWWESKGELALDALVGELVAKLRNVPDTGSLRDDLRGYVRTLVRVYGDEIVGPTQAAIIGEVQSDAALRKAYRERVTEPLRSRSREMFVRAAARGEIASDTDIDLVLDMLVGAVFLRLLFVRGPLNLRFADQLVDVVLEGVLGKAS